MFEIIHIGQMNDCHNDWGIYVDIENSFPHYNSYKEKNYINLYKIDELTEYYTINEESSYKINEDRKMFIYNLAKITIFITTLSYCFWL